MSIKCLEDGNGMRSKTSDIQLSVGTGDEILNWEMDEEEMWVEERRK